MPLPWGQFVISDQGSVKRNEILVLPLNLYRVIQRTHDGLGSNPAKLHTDQLMTRDKQLYQQFFKGLKSNSNLGHLLESHPRLIKEVV